MDSSGLDQSGDEECPKFERFRQKQLNKDYKFKWDMEFNYLVDFREAIREWSVLNVGHMHTYVIKTLVDTHTRDTVLNNRSASSKWVAKVVIKRMQTSETVRICDIMQAIKHKFSVGFSVARAWRAKLIAKKIIEGDAKKPFVGVDGCHLKTKYAGQLLVVVGRDPNDQYFPLAFGVVETETKES
ncbi:hypothetical protein KIW84_056772 [Lathyrus oleraceus]|uniref:Transposase n=1 Tax=Pisum sativum TaxID=3888 RepID=A0A9D4WZ86_PEA|nr:hypothetical protein KIW84_056772 [Pisum sativum]